MVGGEAEGGDIELEEDVSSSSFQSLGGLVN
jgi:hypothetical protein